MCWTPLANKHKQYKQDMKLVLWPQDPPLGGMMRS